LDSSSLEGERPEKIDGNIEFQDVNFNYSSRPKTKILNKVTFKVMAGQKIALVGHSG
jgi:ATP-binding cassette subfamily B (MDR/TAP) protein 1